MKRRKEQRSAVVMVSEPGNAVPKSRRLVLQDPAAKSEDEVSTNAAAAGIASNAGVVVSFSRTHLGELSLTEMLGSLDRAGAAVNANDLSAAERLLIAQAIALNTVFCELTARSSVLIVESLDRAERCMRLGLKAQSQCRATIETLSHIKNPPVVFAKQANFAHGHQQINNAPGALDGRGAAFIPVAREESGKLQNGLLVGGEIGCSALDSGTTATTTRGDTQLEAVGAIERPKKR
jgi:hypothetical protein